MTRLCRILLLFALLAAGPLHAQTPAEEFQRRATQLASQRLAGAEEDPDMQEQVLALLDQLVLRPLNFPAPFDLAALNQQLAALVVQRPPIGEGYRVVSLGTGRGEAVYALVANFSLAGPSAVRLYATRGGRFELRGRIDRFRHKEFFDEYLELVPVSTAAAVVFVTVTGRTDELRTGSFMAWHFADGPVPLAPRGIEGSGAEGPPTLLWASDLLEHSEYRVTAEGFELTYCEEPDEDQPRVCQRKVRDRFVWDGFRWKRTAHDEVAPPGSSFSAYSVTLFP